MQRYANERMIARRAKVGRILSFTGLGVLLLGLILSFTRPELTTLVVVMAVVGVIASQGGIALMNRWGRSPRVDEILDKAVKGMNGQIFHYVLGASHVLNTSAGLFALVPSPAEGEVLYEEGQWWKVKTRRGKRKRKRIRGLEADAEIEMRGLSEVLKELFPDEERPEPQPLIVFIHPEAAINPEKRPPTLATHVKKLKDDLRKLPRGDRLEGHLVARLIEERPVTEAP
jgi:hypothetical protein